MQSNNYEWFISQTVESMLPRFSDEKIGLVMKVGMKWYYFCNDEENEKHFFKEFLIVFHRPHNYTKVFVKDISDYRIFNIDDEFFDIELKSDHDSCWKSDGLRFIFKAFTESWDYFDQYGIEGRKIDPMIHYSMLGNGNPCYRFIDFKKANPSDDYTKDYKIKIGEKIPMNKISEYMPKD